MQLELFETLFRKLVELLKDVVFLILLEVSFKVPMLLRIGRAIRFVGVQAKRKNFYSPLKAIVFFLRIRYCS